MPELFKLVLSWLARRLRGAGQPEDDIAKRAQEEADRANRLARKTKERLDKQSREPPHSSKMPAQL